MPISFEQIAREESERKRSQAPVTKRQKLTLHDMQMKSFAADAEWNKFAMSHVAEREAYERDVDALDNMKGTDVERFTALKELSLSKHRRYCLGYAGDPGAFHLWAEMDHWKEILATYKIDKWTQDDLLNETSYWYKRLFGADDSIDHRHEPAKGVSFRFGALNTPVKKRSSTVSIKNNPVANR